MHYRILLAGQKYEKENNTKVEIITKWQQQISCKIQ